MNPDLSQKAIDIIESICEAGCTEVNQFLEKARDGSEIEELSNFDRKQINLIIDELDQIMSVYDKDNEGCTDNENPDSKT